MASTRPTRPRSPSGAAGSLRRVRVPLGLVAILAVSGTAGVVLAVSVLDRVVVDENGSHRGWVGVIALVAVAVVAEVLVARSETRRPTAPRSAGDGGPVLAWQTTATLVVLLVAGTVPAITVAAACLLAGGLVRPRELATKVFGVRCLATITATVTAGAVLAWGRSASVTELWVPMQATDVLLCLGAGTLWLLCRDGVNRLAGLQAAPPPIRRLLFASGGAQVALSPVIAAVALGHPSMLLPTLAPVFVLCAATRAMRANLLAVRYDELTGLANRERFTAEGSVAVRTAVADDDCIAMLMLDLDRFKDVNEVLGHSAGNRVLVEISHRLQDVLAGRPHQVARLGGDEFAVLLPGLEGVEEAVAIARRITRALAAPMQLQGQTVELETSIGVAAAPLHAGDYRQLMARADTALTSAKTTHRGVRVYESTLDRDTGTRFGLLAALRRALDAVELDVHFQPSVRCAGSSTGEPWCVEGFEALLRWTDAERGSVPPDEFVRLAEESGLIHKLTEHVMRRSLAQAGRWLQQGWWLPISVNVSPRDLEDPEFAARTRHLLQASGVPAQLLVLEVTERVLTGDLAQVRRTLTSLARLGVTASLDDFGTGWSSLLLLRDLPVGEIKLDGGFVRNVVHSPTDAAIVRSVTTLAAELGLRVVAECVETEPGWDALAAAGCDSVQGWLVAPAMPAAQATEWLRGHQTPSPPRSTSADRQPGSPVQTRRAHSLPQQPASASSAPSAPAAPSVPAHAAGSRPAPARPGGGALRPHS